MDEALAWSMLRLCGILFGEFLRWVEKSSTGGSVLIRLMQTLYIYYFVYIIICYIHIIYIWYIHILYIYRHYILILYIRYVLVKHIWYIHIIYIYMWLSHIIYIYDIFILCIMYLSVAYCLSYQGFPPPSAILRSSMRQDSHSLEPSAPPAEAQWEDHSAFFHGQTRPLKKKMFLVGTPHF